MKPSKFCDEIARALRDLSSNREILYMGCLMQWQNKAFTILCEQHFSDVIEVVHKLTMKILNMSVSMKEQFRSFLAQYELSVKDPSVTDESIGPDASGAEPASRKTSSKVDTEAGLHPALRVYSTVRWTYLYICILNFYENLERLIAFISRCPNTTSVLSKRLATQLINLAWIRRLAFFADIFQLCRGLRLLMEGPRIVPGHALLEMGGLRDALQTVLAELRAGAWTRLPRLGARLRDGAALPDEERRSLAGTLEAFVAELDACLSAYRQCLPLLRLTVSPVCAPTVGGAAPPEPFPVPGVDRDGFTAEYRDFSGGERGDAHRHCLERIRGMTCNAARWNALVAFWADQRAAYPQTSRAALGLLTVFATVCASEVSSSALKRALSRGAGAVLFACLSARVGE